MDVEVLVPPASSTSTSTSTQRGSRKSSRTISRNKVNYKPIRRNYLSYLCQGTLSTPLNQSGSISAPSITPPPPLNWFGDSTTEKFEVEVLFEQGPPSRELTPPPPPSQQLSLPLPSTSPSPSPPPSPYLSSPSPSYKLNHNTYSPFLRASLKKSNPNISDFLLIVCEKLGSLSLDSICPHIPLIQSLEEIKLNRCKTTTMSMFSINSSNTHNDEWWHSDPSSHHNFSSTIIKCFDVVRAESSSSSSSPSPSPSPIEMTLLEGELRLSNLEMLDFVRSATTKTSAAPLTTLVVDIMPVLEEALDAGATTLVKPELRVRAAFFLARAEFVLWRIGGGEGEKMLERKEQTLKSAKQKLDSVDGEEEDEDEDEDRHSNSGIDDDDDELCVGYYFNSVERYRMHYLERIGASLPATPSPSHTQFLPHNLLLARETRCIQLLDLAQTIIANSVVPIPHLWR